MSFSVITKQRHYLQGLLKACCLNYVFLIFFNEVLRQTVQDFELHPSIFLFIDLFDYAKNSFLSGVILPILVAYWSLQKYQTIF